MIPEFPENTVVEFNLNINTRAFIKSNDTSGKWSAQRGRIAVMYTYKNANKFKHKEIMKNTKCTQDVLIRENVSAPQWQYL